MPLIGEALHSKMLIDWACLLKDVSPYLIHIANERKCSVAHGYMLKRMGVKAGVSDFFLCLPKHGYHGMWLEMKFGKNKPTDAQYGFLELVSNQGYYSVWGCGFDECKALIEGYLSGVYIKPTFHLEDKI